MTVTITSAENTWREETWQYFFSDDSELVVTIGHAMPENTGDGRHITIDWQTETPEWAVDMTDAQLLELVGVTEVTA